LGKRFREFNPQIHRRQDEIEEALDTGGIILHLIHICLGEELGPHVTNDLNALGVELNGFAEQFRWEFATITKVHGWLIAEQAPPAVNRSPSAPIEGWSPLHALPASSITADQILLSPKTRKIAENRVQ
jgi:hypothetical protein